MTYDKDRAQASRHKHGPRPGTKHNAVEGERLVIDTVVREDTGKFLVVFENTGTGEVHAVPVLQWKQPLRPRPLRSDFWARRPERGSQWKHFKGGTYRVIANAVDDHGNHLVVYRSEQTQGVWARLASVWFEHVDRPEVGYQGPRFSLAG